MSTLEQLCERHFEQAIHATLNNLGWDSINPNDILWAIVEPKMDKQMGSAKRVYNALLRVSNNRAS